MPRSTLTVPPSAREEAIIELTADNWAPFHPAVLADPAAGHTLLLEHAPVHRCTAFDPEFYTLSRFADVDAALRDIDTFSSAAGQGPRFTEPEGMLCDPPQHTAFRSALQDAFSPRAISALRAEVETLSAELIDAALAKGASFDVHDDLAFPLPVVIIARLLGVPDADIEQFKRWSDVQVAAMGAEDPARYAPDMAAMGTYLQAHFRARRAAIARGEPTPGDLLDRIARARYPGDELASERDALSLTRQLLVGGNETTTSLITNLLWRLLEVPERWQQVVADPTLVEPAIEESLRFDPPVLGLYRNTTREVVRHGITIPAGSKVWLNYASANRDPRVFDAPAVFDLHRPRRRHLAFGLGIHMCIGAALSRLEAAVVLRALIQRVPDLRLIDAGERIAPFFLWGRGRLPVAIS